MLDFTQAIERLVRHITANCAELGHVQPDRVVIAEAPDDETIARAALAAGSTGNVRSETMRAFTMEEVARMVGRAP